MLIDVVKEVASKSGLQYEHGVITDPETTHTAKVSYQDDGSVKVHFDFGGFDHVFKTTAGLNMIPTMMNIKKETGV